MLSGFTTESTFKTNIMLATHFIIGVLQIMHACTFSIHTNDIILFSRELHKYTHTVDVTTSSDNLHEQTQHEYSQDALL